MEELFASFQLLPILREMFRNTSADFRIAIIVCGFFFAAIIHSVGKLRKIIYKSVDFLYISNKIFLNIIVAEFYPVNIVMQIKIKK